MGYLDPVKQSSKSEASLRIDVGAMGKIEIFRQQPKTHNLQLTASDDSEGFTQLRNISLGVTQVKQLC